MLHAWSGAVVELVRSLLAGRVPAGAHRLLHAFVFGAAIGLLWSGAGWLRSLRSDAKLAKRVRSTRAQLLPLLLVLAATARADDAAPAATGDEPASALIAKVAQCAAAEAGAPLAADDLALLREFGAELVPLLRSALGDTECTNDAECAAALSDVPCDSLAAPLVAAGYDEMAPLETDPVISAFARVLAERSYACLSGEALDEAGRVELDYRAMQLEHTIAWQVATGTCVVQAPAGPACFDRVRATTCDAFLPLVQRDMQTALCPDLLACSENLQQIRDVAR